MPASRIDGRLSSIRTCGPRISLSLPWLMYKVAVVLVDRYWIVPAASAFTSVPSAGGLYMSSARGLRQTPFTKSSCVGPVSILTLIPQAKGSWKNGRVDSSMAKEVSSSAAPRGRRRVAAVCREVREPRLERRRQRDRSRLAARGRGTRRGIA